MSAKKKLGQILLEAGAIDEYQLKSALGYQKKWGGLLGHVLVENRFITEEALVAAIQQQTGVAVVELAGRIIPDYLLKLVPLDLAEKYSVIPIGLEGETGKSSETLLIAMTDPTNLNALDELQFKTGKRVRPVLAGEKAIADAIAVHYRGQQPGGLDFDIDPEGIQFGGQQVVADELKDDLKIITGTLESKPGNQAPAPAQTPGGLDLEDPFSDLDSLAAAPGPPPSPAPGALDDPFADLDVLDAGADPSPADSAGAHPAATALDFDLDAGDALGTLEEPEAEPLEDLEIIEELEPLEPDPPEPPASSPPPAERDLSMFGEAMDALPGDLDSADVFGETISPLDSDVAPNEGLPGLDQPADLSSVPDLDPAEPSGPPDEPALAGFGEALADPLGPAASPESMVGEPIETGSAPAGAEELGFGFDFSDGDDLDLDSVLAPISPPEGAPPEALSSAVPPTLGGPVSAEEPMAAEEPVATETAEPTSEPPSPAAAPAAEARPAQSNAMKALLSRVGLSSKAVGAEAPAAERPPAAAAPQPLPVESVPEPEAESPRSGALDVAAWTSDPVVEALVHLLVRKGLVDPDELQAELERD